MNDSLALNSSICTDAENIGHFHVTHSNSLIPWKIKVTRATLAKTAFGLNPTHSICHRRLGSFISCFPCEARSRGINQNTSLSSKNRCTAASVRVSSL